MTTIHNLPQELLSKIFESLTFNQLIQAQHVCRAWYLPAHILLLKDICLICEVEPFITSIDQNPSFDYLAAVQKIVLHNVDYPLNKESVGKLICRFPNLETVEIESYASCLDEFDQELCQVVLNSCPKLKHFRISLESEDDEDEDVYCRTMYRLRSLVTYMSLEHVGSASGFGGIIKFIAQFPHLHQFNGIYNDRSIKFREYLVLFERPSQLSSFSFTCDMGETYNFAEEYFAGKSKKEQDLVIERLSKVNDIYYDSAHPFCPNIIKFIVKYLTGLKKLCISCNFENDRWTPIHQQLLNNELSSFLTKTQGYIVLRHLQAEDTVKFLPTTVHKLYSQLPSNNRVLKLDVKFDPRMRDTPCVSMPWPATTQDSPCIKVSISNGPTAFEYINTLFKSQFNDIDHFEFYIDNKRQHLPHINIDAFNLVLKAIPSLRKVTFDLSKDFADVVPSHQELVQYTRMEELTLRLTTGVTIQNMLDTYARMFPNLKCLTLYYYSFAWRYPQRVFCVDLTHYTLERLVLDMTPLKRMLQSQNKTVTLQQLTLDSMTPFRRIVNAQNEAIVICISGKNERYKISQDFSSVSIVSQEDDCQGYVCVQILIDRLDSLECYNASPIMGARPDGYLQYTRVRGVKRIIVF